MFLRVVKLLLHRSKTHKHEHGVLPGREEAYTHMYICIASHTTNEMYVQISLFLRSYTTAVSCPDNYMSTKDKACMMRQTYICIHTYV